MISFLEGTVEHRGERFLIVNTGGIGYRVTVLPKMIQSISKQDGKIKLFIHSRMNVREGTFDLYGFPSRQDLELFGLLTSVSGIGPKNAMQIMSSVEPEHLKAAVVNEDADYLRKVSSIGAKTAHRLVLELKNKVDYLDIGDLAGVDLGQEAHAIDALVALGYTQTQAKEALRSVSKKITDLGGRVREALAMLGKK